MPEITYILNDYQHEKLAKIGQLSPLDIIIPSGLINCSYLNDVYFSNLKIEIKIYKGQINVLNDTIICHKGENSQELRLN